MRVKVFPNFLPLNIISFDEQSLATQNGLQERCYNTLHVNLSGVNLHINGNKSIAEPGWWW